MSVPLKTVFEGLVELGVIFPGNEDEVAQFLNETYGLNVQHDLIITSHEVSKIESALNILAGDYNEKFRNLAEKCLLILE